MTEDWYQLALTSPEVIEVNVRIGVIPSADHVQVLAEMKDPRTGVLVAQWASPHSTMRDLVLQMERAFGRASVWIADAVEPF